MKLNVLPSAHMIPSFQTLYAAVLHVCGLAALVVLVALGDISSTTGLPIILGLIGLGIGVGVTTTSTPPTTSTVQTGVATTPVGGTNTPVPIPDVAGSLQAGTTVVLTADQATALNAAHVGV